MSRGFRKGGTPSSVASSSAPLAGPYNLRSHPELMAKIERIAIEPIVEVTPPPSIQPKQARPPYEEALTLPQSSICETLEKTQMKKKKPRPSLLIDEDSSSESLSIVSDEPHSLDDDNAFLNPKERKRQEKEEVDRLVKKNKKKIYKLVSCCLVPLAAIGLLKRILEGLFV